MRRRLLAVLVVAAAWCCAPAAAHAASTITVDMVGAGTVDLTLAAGTPARSGGCPGTPPLANPDTGPALRACTQTWDATCSPGPCDVRVRATAAVPAPPAIDDAEAGGWRFLNWGAGACQGSTTASCTFTIASCTAAGACTYANVGLSPVFDDRRDPVAAFIDGPPAVVTDPNGVAAFVLRSNEYAQQETSTFQCQLDFGAWEACPGRPGAHVRQGVPDGERILRIRATDPSGRTQSSSIPFHRWIQRYPPVTTFDSGPPDGAVVAADTASFTFHADRDATFECAVDGAEAEPCDGSLDLDGLPDGRHVLEVRATRAGIPQEGVAAAVRTAWTVDTTAPGSAITSAPPFETTDRSATFAFRVEPAGDRARLLCALDRAAPAPCDAGTVTYTGLAPGDHAFTVQAVDTAGNREDPPQQHDWTVVVDADGDGSLAGEDCNDADPSVNPSANDVSGDGVDSDCDGFDGFDDGFGFGTDADEDGDPLPPEGADCDDTDPNVSSFGFEVPQNGIDEDCDGEDELLPGTGVRFRASWQVGRNATKLKALTARRVEPGVRLRLEIDCPKRACRDRVKQAVVDVDAKKLNLLPYLGGRLKLPAGSAFEARAASRGFNPEGRRWEIRDRRRPSAAEFCLRGPAREPGRC